jgi:cytochrome P450
MAAVLLCAAISLPAHAPGKFTLYGLGNESCDKWLAEARDPNGIFFNSMLNWVLGFTSAAGYYDVRGVLRETDSAAISAWIDKYCRQHPPDHLQDAAKYLVNELSTPK